MMQVPTETPPQHIAHSTNAGSIAGQRGHVADGSWPVM
jgi:hypothetical protein